MFAFLVLICIPDSTHCYRIEPEAPSPYQCEMLREDFIAMNLPNHRTYIGKCEELDVD